MPTWKLTIEYDGTRYHGWQSQKNADRTVQGVLTRAARELLGEDVAVGGAGRTDAGVHALAQVAHLKAKKTLPPRDIQFGLNDRLPFDVNVLAVESAAPDFHARHDALSRRYLYRISKRRTAFDKRLVWWVKDRLDPAAMASAAQALAGRHDFAAFCENPDGQDSTVVDVRRASVEDTPEEIVFRIEASHFLWKMVRRVVGTLVEVGRGSIGPERVGQMLAERRPGATAAWTAPPSGLFLERVEYASGTAGPRRTPAGSPSGGPGRGPGLGSSRKTPPRPPGRSGRGPRISRPDR